MSEKTIMRILMKDIFFKSKFSIQKKLHDLHNDLPFLSEKNENWKSWKTCSQLTRWKRICYAHEKFKTNIKIED